MPSSFETRIRMNQGRWCKLAATPESARLLIAACRVRVSLLYNTRAGEGVSLDRVRGAIEQHVHNLVCVVEARADLTRLLEDVPDVVIAAGGDGTIARAARTLARRGVPLAILPLGTANNIARSLAIQGS